MEGKKILFQFINSQSLLKGEGHKDDKFFSLGAWSLIVLPMKMHLSAGREFGYVQGLMSLRTESPQCIL